MNKKMILAILGCPLTAYICYGFYQTSGLRIIHIEKTVTINGTTKEVFEMVKYLKKIENFKIY